MIVLFKIALLLSFGMFAIPKQGKYWLALALQLMLLVPSTAWAWEVLNNGTLTIELGVDTWSGPIHLTIDALSAYFMLIINLICLCGMIYAGGYLKPYLPKKRSVFISLHLFSFVWLHGAMLLVTSVSPGLENFSRKIVMRRYSWYSLPVLVARQDSFLSTRGCPARTLPLLP